MIEEQFGPGAAGTATEADIECGMQQSDTTTAPARSELDGILAQPENALMTPLDRARAYIGRGLAPIPVPFGKKAPKLRDWQKRRISGDAAPLHFNGTPSNIGIL